MSGTQTILDLITGGALDDDLDVLIAAAQSRRNLVAERKALNLEPGDQFFIQNISPKKLEAALVEFVEHDGTSVKTKLVHSIDSRYRAGYVLLLRRSHVGRVRGK